jgi:nicotinate-nucleotide adenylyltransferase
MSERFGILGGTFDPPHNGHLHIALMARKALDLDEVILVPAARNPLKRTATLASPKQRLEMCRLAVKNEDGLSVSDIEITRGSPSYAIETLEELQQVRPAAYWFLMGSDTLRTLPEWHQSERIGKFARIAAYEREGARLDEAIRALPAEYQALVDVVPGPTLSISSSKIRESVQSGMAFEHWLPDDVAPYIKRSNLYR